MADILHDFFINSSDAKVFECITLPRGINAWWTKKCTGQPGPGHEYVLWFGPAYDWRAQVSKYVPDREFELTMTSSDADWQGTRVGFRLHPAEEGVQVSFYHTGWPQANEHYRISCYCWAMYLRILKRFVEKAEHVEYEDRLDV